MDNVFEKHFTRTSWDGCELKRDTMCSMAPLKYVTGEQYHALGFSTHGYNMHELPAGPLQFGVLTQVRTPEEGHAFPCCESMGQRPLRDLGAQVPTDVIDAGSDLRMPFMNTRVKDSDLSQVGRAHDIAPVIQLWGGDEAEHVTHFPQSSRQLFRLNNNSTGKLAQ